MKQSTNNPEAVQILDLVSQLRHKIRLDDSLSYLSDEEYKSLANGIQKLSIDIYNHQLVSTLSHDRLEELTDMMTSIASLDFSKRAYVGEDNNHLDYIAIGLNLLCYQLEKQIKPLLNIKKLYDIANESVIFTDTDFKITEVNSSAEKVFGLSKKSLVDTGLVNYIKAFPTLDARNFTTRNTLEVVHGHTTEKHHFEIYSIHEEGVLTGWAFIGIDNIVANTTLTDLSKKYGIDVDRIHHDVMSPLRSLKGVSELGRITACNDDMVKYFTLVERCRQSIEGHMKDLFDMLFISSTKSQNQLIHFGEILETQLNDLSYLPGFSKIRFNTAINNNVQFHSNKKMISSVLHNLISNAIKYKRNNVDPVINISIKDVEDGIAIEVKDNGIGIKPEHLDEIFKPHFRGTEQSEGKGLGLYILKEAIHDLGGSITTESFYNVGTSFKLFIPNQYSPNT